MNDNGKLVFDFKLTVDDQEFDNDDNPYGQFILHKYTNMDALNDTENDETKI